ncbi:MAG TPA: hypothetical protein VMT80_01050 [Candidatus Paceibacterota bacterium]|nr:hypothetical protein [Candidatus Paceibacterota bacterium]
MDFFKSIDFVYACIGVVILITIAAILRANNSWHSRGITPRVSGVARSTYTIISGGFGWFGSGLNWLGEPTRWKYLRRTVIVVVILFELVAFPLLAFGIVRRPPGVLSWIPDWGTPSFAVVGHWAWANYPVLLSFFGATALIRLFSRWTGSEADGKILIRTTFGLAVFLFIFCPLAAGVQSWWMTRQDSEQAYNKDPEPFSPDVTNTYTLTENTSPFFRADRPTKENEYLFCSTYSGDVAPVWLPKGLNLYRAYSPKGSIEIKYRLMPEKDYPAGCPEKLPS